MQTLEVSLGQRSYPIYVGTGLLDVDAPLRQHLGGDQVLVVSDRAVADIYLEVIENRLHGLQAETLILPGGESDKNLDTAGRIFDRLLEARFDRSCVLIALGGGVVGDVTGFAAACYQRGVDFVQIPTTLLAQVDSSVGGKTGVNHPLGKNMIGAFHQPRCVVVDVTTLDTLPERELRAGLAEVIKYGLLGDAAFFGWLEANLQALLDRDRDALIEAIARCCRNKAEVVAADERESGRRALLNLGHTFGHAIETGTGYGVWLHGEAVATGMIMAADFSHRLGWLDGGELERVVDIVRRAGLPTAPPADLGVEQFRRLMAVDKKARRGQLRLVLLQGIGRAVLTSSFPDPLLDETLDFAGQGRR